MNLTDEELGTIAELVRITYPRYNPDQLTATFKDLCKEIERYKECRIETQTLYYMGLPIHQLRVQEI